MLFLTASTLAAYKITWDLDAFTDQSKRRVDMFAFLLIGLILIILSLIFPADGTPLVLPCVECPAFL